MTLYIQIIIMYDKLDLHVLYHLHIYCIVFKQSLYIFRIFEL